MWRNVKGQRRLSLLLFCTEKDHVPSTSVGVKFSCQSISGYRREGHIVLALNHLVIVFFEITLLGSVGSFLLIVFHRPSPSQK